MVCTVFFCVTLPSEMANLLRLGIKKIKSFVLLSTFRNFAPEYGTETKKKVTVNYQCFPISKCLSDKTLN